MRRRKFITLLGGAATWPLAARVQQPIQRTGKMFSIDTAGCRCASHRPLQGFQFD